MSAGQRSTPPAAPPPQPQPRESVWRRRPTLAALASFVAVLAITIPISTLVRDRVLHAAQVRFDLEAMHRTGDLRRELAACTQTLRAAGGLVATATASGTPIEPRAWRRYADHLQLDEALPGVIRTLGYAGATDAARAGRADPAASPAPFAPVTLLWPETGDTAHPQPDLGGDRAARATLLRAADDAQAALDAHVATSDSTADNHAIANLYLPVYRMAADDSASVPASAAAPRSTLAGFVFARLDMAELVGRIASEAPHVDLRVTAGTPALVLYPPRDAADEAPGDAPALRYTDTLRFGGETLTLAYTTLAPAFFAAADAGGDAVLAAGALAALVIAAAVFALLRRRTAVSAADVLAAPRATLDEARMMAIIRASADAIITIDEAHRIVIFNPMAERVFGVSAMEAIGAPLDRFIPERFRTVHRKHVEQFGVTGVSERQMGKQRVLFGVRENGEEFPIEASISQIRDGTGKLYTVMLRDITERMNAENALKRSREELRELSANLQNVREEEKTRIARELHDDLGQQLTALKMDLSSVEHSLGQQPQNTPPEVPTRLAAMRRLIDATVASVRRIAADLRPVMLDDLGLVPAIEWLANDFATRYGIEVERRIAPGDTAFTRTGATTLFRIVQEALTNVARHAHATRVTIALVIDSEQCTLRIADNGRGAGEQREHSKSFGLLGIRERVHMLGGTVAIETSERQGFAITALFPLAAIQQEDMLR
jgi:PAS domain S-box-containing protein